MTRMSLGDNWQLLRGNSKDEKKRGNGEQESDTNGGCSYDFE